MANILLAVALLAILGGAALYIRKAKKQGQVCIGCPHAKQCAGKCGCGNPQT